MALAVALLGCLAVVPSAASAATYTVFPCTKDVATPPELSFPVRPLGSFIFSARDNCRGAGQMFIEANNNLFHASPGDRAEWSLRVPAFSEIRKLEFNELFFGGPNEDQSPGPWQGTTLAWTANADGTFLEGAGHAKNGHSNGVPASADLVYQAGVEGFPTGVQEFSNLIGCIAPFEQGFCGARENDEIGAEVSSLRVNLTDNGLPTLSNSVDGSLLAQPAHGTGEVKFSGTDEQTGILFSEVMIDGHTAATHDVEPNGSKCNLPFHLFIPCQSDASFTYLIDTTIYADGPHVLKVAACDATEVNCAVSEEFPFTIHNAPTNTAPPSIFGAAKPGSQLTAAAGSWNQIDLNPFSLSYQWLRCPASVTAATQCTPIRGAVDSHYTPSKDDLGMREMIEVTAKLAVGAHASSSSFSAPSDVVAEGQTGGGPAGGHPPQTRIGRRPRRKTSIKIASFNFSSDQADAHFECELDRGTFKPCRSPFKRKVKRGAHVFHVRAVNSAGERDATAAVFRWTVL